jgi:hypothetical protein
MRQVSSVQVSATEVEWEKKHEGLWGNQTIRYVHTKSHLSHDYKASVPQPQNVDQATWYILISQCVMSFPPLLVRHSDYITKMISKSPLTLNMLWVWVTVTSMFCGVSHVSLPAILCLDINVSRQGQCDASHLVRAVSHHVKCHFIAPQKHKERRHDAFCEAFNWDSNLDSETNLVNVLPLWKVGAGVPFVTHGCYAEFPELLGQHTNILVTLYPAKSTFTSPHCFFSAKLIYSQHTTNCIKKNLQTGFQWP